MPAYPRIHRKAIFPALLCLTFFPLISCGFHKLRPEERERNEIFAEILKREDLRVLGDDDFLRENLTSPPYPEVGAWSALALARIGNPRALPWLYKTLGSPDARTRAYSAFAIGEIEDRDLLQENGLSADPGAEAELIRRMNDSSLAVQMRAIEALGKIGSRTAALAIVNRLAKFNHGGSPQERSFLDLSITALTRLNDPIAFPILERMASIEDPEIEWRVENALIRLRDRGAREIFVRLLNSSSPDVQAYAARGIGICDAPDLATLILPLIRTQSAHSAEAIPLAVRVCALQALGDLRNPVAVSAIGAALADAPIDDTHPEQVNFAVQAASTLGEFRLPEARAQLVRLLEKPDPVGRSALIALAHSLSADHDRFFDLVQNSMYGFHGSQAAWAEALAALGGPKASRELRSMLVQALAGGSDPIQSAATPAIITALTSVGGGDTEQILEAFLGSHDGMILQAAVRGFKPSPGSPKPWNLLIHAYERIAQTNQVDAKVAIISGLQPWISRSEVQQALRTAFQDRQWRARIASMRLLRMAGLSDAISDAGPAESNATDIMYRGLASRRRDRITAILETSRGDIELELYPEDAPLTVANFLTLANPAFIKQLSFVRVVPRFEIQANNPADNQARTLGFTMRSEVNMRPFVRGSIGLAPAGIDSAESRFFITTSPQPQLDGKLTCFGRVVSGMQVADRITSGDRIQRIVVKVDKTVLDYRRF